MKNKRKLSLMLTEIVLEEGKLVHKIMDLENEDKYGYIRISHPLAVNDLLEVNTIDGEAKTVVVYCVIWKDDFTVQECICFDGYNEGLIDLIYDEYEKL